MTRFAVAVTTTLAAIFSSGISAFAADNWCEKGSKNCWFYSLEQCRWAASGNGGFCEAALHAYSAQSADNPREVRLIRARPHWTSLHAVQHARLVRTAQPALEPAAQPAAEPAVQPAAQSAPQPAAVAKPTPTKTAVSATDFRQICACNGRGDALSAQTLYGPKDAACGGVADWGKYQQACGMPSRIAKCSPPAPAADKDVQFWGPAGEPCNGQSAWGQFAAGAMSTRDVQLGSCKGQGSLSDVTLWGPVGDYCGGFASWGTYTRAGSAARARSDEVVTLKVDEVCHGIADQSSDSLQAGEQTVSFDLCMKAEQEDRDTIKKEWSTFSSDDKRHCIAEATTGGESSYTDLVTCLEMARDVRELRSQAPSEDVAYKATSSVKK